MTVSSVPSAARVLHVGSPTAAAAAAPLAQLVWAAIPVEHCPDLYRALARLGAAGRKTCAILVGVDDLDPRQLEFFRVVARYHARVPVYLYAEPHSEAVLDRCVELGARGRFTADALRALALIAAEPDAAALDEEPPAPLDEFAVAVEAAAAPEASTVEAPTASQPPSEQAESPEAPSLGEAAAGESFEYIEPHDPFGDLDDELMELAEDEVTSLLEQEAEELTEEDLRRADADANERGPARVPWLRYDDHPVRVPPPRQAPGQPVASDPLPEPQDRATEEVAEPEAAEPEEHAPDISAEDAIDQILAEEADRLAAEEAQADVRDETAAGDADQSTDEVTDAVDDDYEPLLTVEELEALIGDDDAESPPAPRREERHK